MRKLPYKTTTFHTGKENFLIDIVEYTEVFRDGTTEKMYAAWLYRYDIGIKSFVVGEMKKYYKGVSLEEYAQHIIEYCSHVWDNENGYTAFDWYDKDYFTDL